MIEIKVKAEVGKTNPEAAKIDIENNTKGSSIEVMHESLAVVRAVSETLKKHDPLAHLLFVRQLVDDKTILLGEGFVGHREETANKILADIMSEAIINDEERM